MIPTEPIGSIPRPTELVQATLAGVPRATAPVKQAVISASALSLADDGGFAPFVEQRTMSRECAFARVRPRVAGTALAGAVLEGSG